MKTLTAYIKDVVGLEIEIQPLAKTAMDKLPMYLTEGYKWHKFPPALQEIGVAVPVFFHVHDVRECRVPLEPRFVPLGASSDLVSELGQVRLDLLDVGVRLGPLSHRSEERLHGLCSLGDLSHRDGLGLRRLVGGRLLRRGCCELGRGPGSDEGQKQGYGDALEEVP